MSSVAQKILIDAEGRINGKKVRFSDETPKRIATIDFIMALLGVSEKSASQILKRIEKKNAEVSSSMTKHQFSGQGQRNTPVTGAVGLLRLIQLLPARYPIVQDFLKEQNTYIARLFGGDLSIKDAADDFHAAQQEIPADHPMRLFGEAVESGQIGGARGRKRKAEPSTPDAIEWKETRTESKSATIAKANEICKNIPGANPQTYRIANGSIGYAVTGEFPSEFKRKRNIRRNTRDHYTREQLAGVIMMEGMMKKLAGKVSSATEFEDSTKRLRDSMYNICKDYGIHGDSLLTAGDPKSIQARHQIEPAPTAETKQKAEETEKEEKPKEQKEQQPNKNQITYYFTFNGGTNHVHNS